MNERFFGTREGFAATVREENRGGMRVGIGRLRSDSMMFPKGLARKGLVVCGVSGRWWRRC